MQPADLMDYPPLPLPLPWTEEPEQKALFHRLVALCLGVSLSLFLIVTLVITPPEIERQQREKVPQRLARLILERKPVPLPTLEEPELTKPELKKPELKKPELKKPEPPKPEKAEPAQPTPQPKLEPEQPKQLTRPIPASIPASIEPTPEQLRQARDTAARSGILALQSQLQALQNLSVLNRLEDQPLSNVQAGRSRRNNRDLLGRGALMGSGGIQATALTNASSATLADRQTTRIHSLNEIALNEIAPNGIAPGSIATPAAQGGNGVRIKQRSPEEISLVFDRHKAAFYALYRRALRSQLGLQGKIVFNFSIDPAGQVIDCRILSSELNNRELERKLRARVMLLAFEAKSVEPWQGLYHIDFLPAG
ncbi:MAG: protein TonB [Motiliproteus sp.]|jgi:protein TonB